MKKLQESITKFFSSKTTLIVNAAIGVALWITNAVFNLLAGDYLGKH